MFYLKLKLLEEQKGGKENRRKKGEKKGGEEGRGDKMR